MPRTKTLDPIRNETRPALRRCKFSRSSPPLSFQTTLENSKKKPTKTTTNVTVAFMGIVRLVGAKNAAAMMMRIMDTSSSEEKELSFIVISLF